MALAARLMFFISVPLHSDDYFRFFWDGHLVLHDIDPYAFTPTQLLEMEFFPLLLEPIYQELNSPNYFSVYPITNQIFFTTAAWLGGSSILGFVVWLRVALILADLLGIWALCQLLKAFKMDANHALLYAVNPLILLEITGNLHFEGLMLTFIFLGIWALTKRKYFSAGGGIGMAISIKLTPLIILPMVLKYLKLKDFIVFISALILICALFFLPIFAWSNVGNFISSLQLYYGKFEFNASIHYLIRELGYIVKGYNVIGSTSFLLSLMVFLIICYLAWSVKIDRVQVLIQLAIAAYFVYLLMGMVVHPWYIIPLIGLGVLGNKYSPLIWSYLIYISYYAYSVEPYEENFILLLIQYIGLLLMIIVEYYPYLFNRKKLFPLV